MENKPTENKPTIVGFKPPELDGREYIFGDANIPSDILQPNGDWSEFLPSEESQIETQKLIETFTCTVFGTSNVLETLMRRKFGGEYDYSDRALAIASGVDFRQGGADPQVIAETIRKRGLVEQYILPNFNDIMKTIDDFLAIPPLFQKVLDTALEWLRKWAFGHDLLSKGQLISKETIREALKHSPLGVAVFAWVQDNDKYYRPPEAKDTHFVLLYKMDEDGTAYIFDSYPPYRKVLRNDFGFYWAKRYYVNRLLTETEKISFLEQIRNAVSGFVEFLKDYLKNAPKPPIVEPTPNIPTEPEKPNLPPPNPLNPPYLPPYLWDTSENSRHSCRVICDNMGLSVAEKNLLCQVIRCESGFDINAIHHNNNGTSDFSLCQYNSKWWVGKDKPFKDKQDVYDNPKRQIEIMIGEYRKGRLNQWVCFKNGNYKRFTA